MSVYAETSVLASSFLIEERSPLARQILLEREEIIVMTPLSILELRNSFNLAVVRKKITSEEVDQLWTHFEEMLEDGVFLETAPSTAALYEKARELSDRHTANLATRSLDLLHVAAAILLEVDAFYTFDERQRSAAVSEGLPVFP